MNFLVVWNSYFFIKFLFNSALIFSLKLGDWAILIFLQKYPAKEQFLIRIVLRQKLFLLFVHFVLSKFLSNAAFLIPLKLSAPFLSFFYRKSLALPSIWIILHQQLFLNSISVNSAYRFPPKLSHRLMFFLKKTFTDLYSNYFEQKIYQIYHNTFHFQRQNCRTTKVGSTFGILQVKDANLKFYVLRCTRLPLSVTDYSYNF